MVRIRGVRRLAAALVIVTVASLGVPPMPYHAGGSLWQWLFAPQAAGATPPVTPQQWSGTAAGHRHQVPAGATGPTGAGRAARDRPLAPDTPPSTTPALDDGREHFDPARSVRLASAATATSDVYRNPDGTYTRKVYELPVNYRAADGTWKPIDRTLAQGADGRLHERASGRRLDLARRAGDPALVSWDGRLSYTLHGAADVAGVVSGGTVRYPGVLPGTDLVVRMTSAGWKESLVLAAPPTTNSWLFPLALHGLTAAMTPAGAVELRDQAGSVQVRVPTGHMHDSAVDPRSGGFATSHAVTYQLDTVGGRPALKVTADAAWLADRARVYPVDVDPSGETFATSADTYVDDDDSSDHSGDNELLVGTWNGGGERTYSFLAFTGFQSTYANTTMSSVKLHIFDSWAWTCTPEPFNVNPITSSWSVGSVTYPGPTFGASIGSVTANPGAACTNTKGDRSVGTWMTVNLSTATFQGWINGTTTNHGLAVTASQSDSTQWKRFTSRNGPAGKAPYLEVSYTAANLPPQVSQASPPYGYHVTTLTPELQVRATDPEGAALSYRFQVFDKNDTKIADSGTVAAATWAVPLASGIRWGQNYTWTGQAYDGAKWSPAYEYAFATPVPQPPVTSMLAQNGGQGFSPAIGNYTTSATDASVATVGPALAIVRAYNSADPRRSDAFGAGWASLVDMRATEARDAAGVLQTVVVTYPDGQDVAYGRNSDGTFTPPAGRFASFTSVTGGYQLIDKSDVTYKLTTATGVTGQTGLTSITDASGRVESVTWTGGHPTTITAASGRTLTLAWSTPSGASAPHVTTVTSDPVTAGQPATALTYTYAYAGDALTKMCPPETTTACTGYEYSGTATTYPSTVLNLAPRSYWRLGEASGSSARSEVLYNQGTDAATYTSVTLGQAGPLAGSTGKAAGFNGTSSSVAVPATMVSSGTYQSASLWFKTSTTTGAVLFSEANAATGVTPSHYSNGLYVGVNGKLYGGWWTGTITAIGSAAAVNDGAWHHAVLTAAGTVQVLYLDGVAQATLPGVVNHLDMAKVYIGAGYANGGYPSGPTGGWRYLNGLMAEVSLFDRPLTAAQVAAIYQAGTIASTPLTAVTRPSGKAYAAIAYDPSAGTVTQVIDANGGVWRLNAPTVSGSNQVYAGAVLSDGPADYWRMTEPTGPTAVNEVYGGTASCSSVTLGGTAGTGPFPDTTSGLFNGTSSYVRLPDNLVAAPGPMSVEAWFKTTTYGLIFNYQAAPNGQTNSATTDALYVGTDGKLHGGWWSTTGMVSMTSPSTVTDNTWHHAALTGDTAGRQALYLDGNQVASVTGKVIGDQANPQPVVNIGGGRTGTSWPGLPSSSWVYFNGRIGEVAFYRTALSSADVDSHVEAAAKTAGAPAQTVAVIDPGSNTVATVFDLTTGRITARTDALGGTSRFGYDDNTGFQVSVTDPNGNTVSTARDVRGNVTASTDCLTVGDCHTAYYTYFPDATTKILTPDPRNDMLLTARDARSAGTADNTYKTTYGYDAKGNPVAVTTPPVAGWPAGRTTSTVYTDGTAAFPATDGGNAPPGLPANRTTPGGATTTWQYFHDGDLAQVTDPAGQVTGYTYDNLGRMLTRTVTSDTYPAGLTTRYTYDGHGSTLTVTSPGAANRVTGVVHTAQTTYTYDADDLRLTSTTADLTGGDASRHTAQTYDAHDHVATATDANGKVTSYGYDGYGNRTSVIDPLSRGTDYSFDADGHQLTATLVGWVGDPVNPSAPANLVLESRAYDPAGRLASVTDTMGYVTAYTYTANGHARTVTRVDPAHGLSFVIESDTYDGAGNLVNQVTNNGSTTRTITVDAASRPVAQALDPAGVNRTTTWAYTGDDATTAVTVADATGSSTTYTGYDLAGNVIATATPTTATAPVARWKLDETSGATAADSAGNSPATASGVTWSGAAASFNGTSSYLAVAPGMLDTTASFTVSAKVTLTDKAADRPVATVSSTGSSPMYLQYQQSSDRWQCQMPNQSGGSQTWYSAVSTAAPVIGAAATLTCTYDQPTNTVKLYVNGTLQQTVTGVHTFTDPRGTFWIGRSGSRWYAGTIRDVQIYQRALSASEVSAVHAGSAPAAGDQTVRTTFARDTRGAVVAVTDPDGNVTNLTNDELGRPVVRTAPAVPVEVGGDAPTQLRPATTTGIDTFGGATDARDANGNVTVTGFDPLGRTLTVTRVPYTPPATGTPITPTSTFTYDAAGRLTSATDGLQRTVGYTYTQLDDVATMTAPNTGVTHLTWDTLGEQLSATGPTGAVTQATYDYLDRVVTATTVERQPASQAYTTTYAYGTGGFLNGTTSAGGVQYTYGHNALGERSSRTNGGGFTTTYAYDYAGRQAATIFNDGKRQTVTYDRAGRAVATGRWLNATNQLQSTSADYDPAGRLTALTGGRGFTTTFAYDALGRLTTQVEPVATGSTITTSYGYDAAGNQTRSTDGRGNRTITTYNPWHLPESRILPYTAVYATAATSTYTTSYDAAGQPVTQALPGGVTVNTSYNSLGQVSGQTGTGAEAVTVARSFGYDMAGRLTSLSAPGGTDTFTRDDRGNVLTVAGGSGPSSFTWDADGRMASRTDAAGTSSYTYNSSGFLATDTDAATGTVASYTHNGRDQVQKITYGGGDSRNFVYDGQRRLLSDTLKTAGGTSIASITYTYDLDDDLLTKVTTGLAGPASNTYTYDQAARLTSWNDGTTTVAYGYDAAGNRTSVGGTAYTYDTRNQLVTGGGTGYTYTPRGTMAAAGTLPYTADAFGQTVTAGAVSYDYDAAGRLASPALRYSGLDNTPVGDGTATYSLDPSGRVVAEKSAGTGVLAWTDLHTDVVAQFLPAGTAVHGSTSYDPMGAVTATSGMLGMLGFQSGYTDLAAGKVSMHSRWYNLVTGQFDNRDSALVSGVPNSAAANPFAYGAGNPLTRIDPTGHQVIDVDMGGGLGGCTGGEHSGCADHGRSGPDGSGPDGNHSGSGADSHPSCTGGEHSGCTDHGGSGPDGNHSGSGADSHPSCTGGEHSGCTDHGGSGPARPVTPSCATAGEHSGCTDHGTGRAGHCTGGEHSGCADHGTGTPSCIGSSNGEHSGCYNASSVSTTTVTTQHSSREYTDDGFIVDTTTITVVTTVTICHSGVCSSSTTRSVVTYTLRTPMRTSGTCTGYGLQDISCTPATNTYGSVPSNNNMLGICVDPGAARILGLSGSLCLVHDDHGWGTLETANRSIGAQWDFSFGLSLVSSNGDIADQAGRFDNVDGQFGFLTGSVQFGTGQNGQPVSTEQIGVSIKPGLGVDIGKSQTWQQFGVKGQGPPRILLT